jgi:hypothetical protein
LKKGGCKLQAAASSGTLAADPLDFKVKFDFDSSNSHCQPNPELPVLKKLQPEISESAVTSSQHMQHGQLCCGYQRFTSMQACFSLVARSRSWSLTGAN